MTAAHYKRLRKSIGTQEQAARALSVHRVTIAKREAGTLSIPQEAAAAMRWLAKGKTEKRFE